MSRLSARRVHSRPAAILHSRRSRQPTTGDPSARLRLGDLRHFRSRREPFNRRRKDSVGVGGALALPAAEIEKQVEDAIQSPFSANGQSSANAETRPGGSADLDNSRAGIVYRKNPDDLKVDLRSAIERVTISRTTISIQLTDAIAAESRDRTLTLRWTPPSPTRRREIIQAEGAQNPSIRPMRVKARAGLFEALRNAHRWLDELLAHPELSIETIAAREGRTERSIRMTLSLAFLAHGIVKAAIEGRLPRGFGVTRLTDPPMLWSQPMGRARARGSAGKLKPSPSWGMKSLSSRKLTIRCLLALLCRQSI